jgi:hypothetical protein
MPELTVAELTIGEPIAELSYAGWGGITENRAIRSTKAGTARFDCSDRIDVAVTMQSAQVTSDSGEGFDRKATRLYAHSSRLRGHKKQWLRLGALFANVIHFDSK